jgi:hypothetical protein
MCHQRFAIRSGIEETLTVGRVSKRRALGKNLGQTEPDANLVSLWTAAITEGSMRLTMDRLRTGPRATAQDGRGPTTLRTHRSSDSRIRTFSNSFFSKFSISMLFIAILAAAVGSATAQSTNTTYPLDTCSLITLNSACESYNAAYGCKWCGENWGCLLAEPFVDNVQQAGLFECPRRELTF